MLLRSTLTTILVALAQPAYAAPDGGAIVNQGSGQGAPACATCHGENGAGLAGANFVRLAGLNETYLTKQLRDFKSGARENPIMQPIASALTDEEMAAVARYFARRPEPAVAGQAVDEALASRGAKLARDGDWNRDVPACFQCHGENGAGVPPNFPALAAQPAAYTTAQLKAWRIGTRHNDPVELMATVASKLSDEEIDAVAAYLATLAPRSEAP